MSLIAMDNPLDVPARYEECYTPQNTLIYENMRGLNRMEFDATASKVVVRAGSVIEVNGVLLKAANEEEVSISSASLALAASLDDGNVTPVDNLSGYKYDPLRRGVYKGNSRLFHTLVKRAAGTTGFSGSTVTTSATVKFWVSKGLHIFYIRGGRGGDGGLGGKDSNYAGGAGAAGAPLSFLHFERKGQWAVAVCGWDGMPPLIIGDSWTWAMNQGEADVGGGGGCSGCASIVILQDGTAFYALGGSGGGGGSGSEAGSGSKGGATSDGSGGGAGGGGGVGSNDNGGGSGGDVPNKSYREPCAGGGGNGGKRSAPPDGASLWSGDGGLGPCAGGGAAWRNDNSKGACGGPGSLGSGGFPSGENRNENWLTINGGDGFPSPAADPIWWDLSAADLASQFHAVYSGGGAGGGDYNDEHTGASGGTMIWSASNWLSRSGGQIITDYQVS
jgi:hypothetical protein